MIIEEYDESLFISRFEDYERVVTAENKNGNFSYKGLRYLFDYLDEMGDEENPYKLDVIGLCCDYSEYADLEEYLKDYSNQHEETIKEAEESHISDEDFKENIEEEINDNTTLIKFGVDLDDGFIIAVY